MTARTRIEVPGLPVGQPRQRHTRSGHNYIDKDHGIHAFKAAVRLAWRQATQDAPATGPIELVASFIFPRPKSLIWKRRAMPRLPHAKKPDNDNLLKAIQDALNNLAWNDDSQVCRSYVEKLIADGDEQPRTIIEVVQLDGVYDGLRG